MFGCLYHSLPCISRQGVSLNLVVLSRVATELLWWGCLLPSPRITDGHRSLRQLVHGWEGSELGSPAWASSSSLAEPFLQPRV